MSNTSAAIRGSKSGMAPPGRRFTSHASGDTESGMVSAAVASCASSTCCLGDDEAALGAMTTSTNNDNDNDNDNKYRKRLYQRKKQRRLRDGLLLLFLALCLLVYTVFSTRDDGSRMRFAQKGELPSHYGQNKRRRHNHGIPHNDDHNKGDFKDDLIDDERRRPREGEFPGRGGGRGRRRGRGGEFPDDEKRFFDRLDGRNGGDDSTDEENENETDDKKGNSATVMERRLLELEELTERMDSNTNTTIRWADMSDVPPLPGRDDKSRNKLVFEAGMKRTRVNNNDNRRGGNRKFFQIHRSESTPMAWEKEFQAIVDKDATARPDYVNYVHHTYEYPNKLMEPPELGKYPNMRTYKELMDTWPQDNLDNPPDVLQEDLIHFDWNIPADMEAAVKFRDAKLPFKVVNVPEVLEATKKWTDEYIAQNFDTSWGANGPQSNGKCNEGPDNYFAFFNAPLWNVEDLGIPPTRDNDWSFALWAKHSRYADRVGLDTNLPHYYWQSGVPRGERFQSESKWTFVSRDLPSFSSTTDNFVLFHSDYQKGIQCRFGERGITAANHYDSGRNMITMITGAKRYILSPPRACKHLGVVSSKGHASFRHSMLNYGHIALMDTRDDMPQEEREWLEIVGSADAVSTVLKEGEILYVPTGWFHYITSLQKSAQCNVRSGPDMEGDAFWGGAQEITEQCFPHQ
jgi:hypothetical protein